MNYEQFAIWLHGFLEISNAEEINKEQTQIIKDHLALLFEKKTPDRKEKKEADNSLEPLKKLAGEIEKRRAKDAEYPKYPKYPPYAPMPMPTYPGFDPHKITCSDGTGSPPPELGTSVSDLNPYQEIPLCNIKPSRQKKYKVSNPQIISRIKHNRDRDEEKHAIRMAEGRARDQTGNFYYF